MESNNMYVGEGPSGNPGGPNLQDEEDNVAMQDSDFERVLQGEMKAVLMMMVRIFWLDHVDLSALEKLTEICLLCLKIPKVNPMILKFPSKSGFSKRREKGLMKAPWEIFEKCAVWFLQKDSRTNLLRYADQLGPLQDF